MAVLDAFALVALALNEPAAAEVEAAIRRGGCYVSAVNLAEALDQLSRVHGHSMTDLQAGFEPALESDIAVVAVDAKTAWIASELLGRHYRRRQSELSLADCLALATSVQIGTAMMTADPALARAARAEGVDLIALPDSQGRRP